MSGGEPCPEDLGANITGDSDCSNAPLITTNGTYYGNTTAFTNLPAPPPNGHFLADTDSHGITIENVGYYKFQVMDKSKPVEVTICSSTSCSGSGHQIYMFTNCTSPYGKIFTFKQIFMNGESGTTNHIFASSPVSVSYTEVGGGCLKITVSNLDPGYYYFAIDGYNGADYPYSLAFGSGIVNVLSIDLTSFTDEAHPEGNLLTWETAKEKNNDYFELQSTLDGENYITIGRVQGAGDSKVVRQYRYMDYTNESVTYYRLKQVDYDGTATYHPVVVVNRNQKGDLMLSPNPVENTLFVDINASEKGNYTFSFINEMGATVESNYFLNKGNNRIEIDLDSKLSNGFYILKVSNENGVVNTSKFVKR